MQSTQRTGTRRTAMVGVVMATLVAVGTGCSATDRSSTPVASGGEAADVALAEQASADGAGSGDGATAATATESQPVSTERIDYTATLRVRVDDPSETADEAMDVVKRAGGSLADQFEDGGDEVRLTVRVPVDRFHEVLDDVAELGVELGREVSAEEVTDRIVDLDARLRNARASADRLRELFADAADVDQVVAVESALTEREAEVETLAAQLAAIEDRADRSTLTVSFVDEGEPPVDDEEDDASAFVRGLRTGWDAVQGVGTAVAAAAGFVLPMVPLFLVGLVAWVVVRRRRGRHDDRSDDVAATTPTEP